MTFKSSYIASLKSCRFDKVKLVYDSIIQTLQAWKSVLYSNGHLPSPCTSAKEKMHGTYCSDLYFGGSWHIYLPTYCILEVINNIFSITLQ
jgi:hypothetical protein